MKKRVSVHTIGDPVLKAVAAPVLQVTPEIRQLANDMLVALRVFNGIGIAAPQYGVSLRLVILDVPQDSVDPENVSQGEEMLLPSMPLALVNPEIVSFSEHTSERDEGCLSVPDFFAPVRRPDKVLLHSSTLSGQVIDCECGGLLGRCIQHELDHLDGYLFTDRLSPEDAQKYAREIESVRKGGVKRKFLRTKSV